MSTEIIEKSAFYQEALAKGIARGIEQGKAEGIEQGLEQGKAEGLRDAIMVILHARFGEPTPDVTQALASAQAGTLENVLEHAMSETLDDVRARLGL